MSLFVLLISICLVLAASLFQIALMRLNGRLPVLIAIPIVFSANVILVSQTLGLLGCYGNYALTQVGQAVLLLLSFVLWRYYGKDNSPVFPEVLFTFERPKVLLSLKQNIEVFALASAGVIALIFSAGLILVVPLNMDDVLTCYLPRIGYWLQFGSFAPWPTEAAYSGYSCQTSYPMVTELLMGWLFICGGSDRLLAFVSWTASVLVMVEIYGLSRLLNANRSSSLFAAFLWITLPAVLLQTTQGLTDIVFTAFFLALIYFAYYGLMRRSKASLLLAAVSAGLAFGTKQIILFSYPGFAISIILIWLLVRSRAFWYDLAFLVLFSCVMILILGFYSYGQNWFFYGNPLGPDELINAGSNIDPSGNMSQYIVQFCTSLTMFINSFFDFTLLPAPISRFIYSMQSFVLERIVDLGQFDSLGSIVNYETIRFKRTFGSTLILGVAGYGPVPVLLLLGLVVAAFRRSGNLRNNVYYYGFMIIGGIHCLLVLTFKSWSLSVILSRYMMVPMALFIAMSACLFQGNHLFAGHGKKLIALLAIYVLCVTFMKDGSKPLAGARTILNMDYIDKQTLTMPSGKKTVRFVDENVPPENVRIGFAVNDKFPVQPLFGKNFSRTVIPLYPMPAVLGINQLDNFNVDYFLTDSTVIGEGLRVGSPAKLFQDKKYTIWKIWRAALKSPNNGRALMDYGMALMAAGKYDEALPYFKGTLAMNPAWATIHINMGILRGAMGFPQEAEMYFKNAIKLQPYRPDAYYHYARWLIKARRIDEAVLQLETGNKLSPGYTPIIEMMAALRKADPAQLQRGNIVEPPEALVILSLQCYSAGDFQGCIKAAEDALRLRPDYAPAYNNICVAWNRLGEWDKAVAAGERAVALDPGSILASNNLAWAKSRRGKQR